MSNIKFHHLQVGQQFEFRGDHYTKVSPLIASNNADGKQKMIPRSALVTIAGDGEVAHQQGSGAQHPALAVLERYHQAALAELQSLDSDEEKVGAARARLESLRAELAQAIEEG